MNWRGFEFFKVQGEVTRTDIWSETKVFGDKDHVSSSSEAKQSYWITYGDGKETDVILPLADFNAKAGHKVTLVALNTDNGKSVTCLVLNNSTGNSCWMNNAHSLTSSRVKIALLWLGLVAGVIVTLGGSIANSGPAVILGIGLLGLAVWSKLSISSDEKDFHRIVDEYARAA